MRVLHSSTIIMENKLVDIHSHILFGIDDGAKTIEESIEMKIRAMKLFQ